MHLRLLLLLAISACLVTGCGERVSIGSSGYQLFTPDTLPDGHPGTALRYKGKEVWPSVSAGYIHNSPADYYHDGILIFVGSVPSLMRPEYTAQLFAIRGAEAPVLISQRVFHLPITNSFSTSYFIDDVSPVPSGFRVEMKFWLPSTNPSSDRISVTNNISWADITAWVKEAESLPITQPVPSEAFRLLP